MHAYCSKQIAIYALDSQPTDFNQLIVVNLQVALISID